MNLLSSLKAEVIMQSDYEAPITSKTVEYSQYGEVKYWQ